mgnify:CR=1 FL=1
MNDVILSIKQQYIDKIIDGSKTIEIRRRPPLKINRGSMIFFAQSGSGGMIVGDAMCAGITMATPQFAWEHYKDDMQISEYDFNEYTKGRAVICLIKLIMPQRYEKPLSVKHFGLKRIPQSFCYF